MEYCMNINEMLQVIEALANGRDLESGELVAYDSQLGHPKAIQALFGCLQLLRRHARRPPNAGKPWRVEDEAMLAAGHATGRPVAEMARAVGRTPGSVKARLVHLGLLDEATVNLRFAP